jgi:type IX secretion system PorP/SprF family membrane protein
MNLKKSLLLLVLLLPEVLYGQQFPFMDGYTMNPFTLSPAYAGIKNGRTLFIDYRSDWTGLEGSPTTCQLSYSDKFNKRVGLGARFIFDKTDIFKHTLVLGTYTYEVSLANEHILNFGLSLGFYRNSIDFAKYYNDPGYVQDLVLQNGLQKSKALFATDISVLYRYKHTEAGILFSNMMLGTARYRDVDLTYRPLKNYLLHASYLFTLDDKWSVKPTVVIRGGQKIPVMFELSPSVVWRENFWGTARFRSGGILGMGLGGEIYKGIIVNYSYNIITNISLYTFGSHQLSLGIRIGDFLKKDNTQ